MSVFDTVREIPFEDVCRHYGISIAPGKKCVCPFHTDSHPSMKLYKDHGYCFACNTYADSVKMIAQVCGMTQLESAQSIASSFGLESARDSAADIKARKQLLAQREQQKLLADQTYQLLATIYQILGKWAIDYAPKSAEEMDNCDERFTLAVEYRSYLDYVLDEYISSKDQNQWLTDVQNSAIITHVRQKILQYARRSS